jgi:hypothetical protein
LSFSGQGRVDWFVTVPNIAPRGYFVEMGQEVFNLFHVPDPIGKREGKR